MPSTDQVSTNLSGKTAHELGFTAFLAQPTQRRIRTLLELGPKRRRDVRALLDHSVDLEPRYARRLEANDASARATEAVLRKLGAPSGCFVISADEALDGREMLLEAALDAVSGSFFGSFISCMPGKLGYYEFEDRNPAYLLQR